MGYRSNVRIITTKNGYDELNKYINDYSKNFNKDNFYNLLSNTSICEKTEKGYYLGWDWVKWYEEYNDVSAIMNGLKHLQDKNISYRFARIGEDNNDYEEMNYNSNSEKEQGLDYPSCIREFDDEYVIESMNTIDNHNKEVEL